MEQEVEQHFTDESDSTLSRCTCLVISGKASAR